MYFVHPQEMPKDVTINRDMLKWFFWKYSAGHLCSEVSHVNFR